MTKKNLTVCIDANIVVCLAIGDKLLRSIEKKWESWLQNDYDLIAPYLFSFEVTSAIWRYVHQQVISNEQGLEVLEQAFAHNIKLLHPINITSRAWEITKQLNLPQCYDAHYLALAEIYDCEFWTLDERFYQAAHAKYPRTNLIT